MQTKQAYGVSERYQLIFIALLTFFVYANGIGNGFVADDNGFIVGNPSIRDLRNIPSFFYAPETMAADKEWGTIIYRPLRTASYAIDYALYGLDSRGYHATNLGLHILVCIVFYYVIKHLFSQTLLPFVSTLIFAVHPIHVEAVSWIASRADLLGMLFFSLSLLCYILFRKKKASIFLLLSLLFSFTAYLGKETMVPLTGMIVLCDYVLNSGQKYRDSIRSAGPVWLIFFILCVSYLALRLSVTGRMSTEHGWWGGSIFSNFLMMSKAAAIYFSLFFFPFSLKLHYMIEPVHTILDLRVMLSFLVIAGICAAAVFAFKKSKPIFFSLVYFLFSLIPIANIIPISFSMMAERYAYMPSAGPIILIAFGISSLYEKAQLGRSQLPRWTVIGFAGIIIITFSFLVVRRNSIYHDDFIFYKTAISESPRLAVSYKNLADKLQEKGEYREALVNYGKSLELDPRYAETYLQLASVNIKTKDFISARTNVEKALSVKPSNAQIRYMAGNIYKDMGDLSLAVMQWEKAVTLDPRYADAYNSIGNYYLLVKDYVKAAEMYERCLALNPQNVECTYNMALISEAMGDLPRAKGYYGLFIRLAGRSRDEYKEAINGVLMKYPDLR